MTIPKQALGFGFAGLLAVLWMLLSLWRGEISSRGRAVICRDSEPLQFYAWIFFYALLATLFIGAGVFFFMHPHFSLVPPAEVSDD